MIAICCDPLNLRSAVAAARCAKIGRGHGPSHIQAIAQRLR